MSSQGGDCVPYVSTGAINTDVLFGGGSVLGGNMGCGGILESDGGI
jgi:hypothetical protein